MIWGEIMRNNKDENDYLGYFLTLSQWVDSVNLLDFQIKQKATNGHYNTLNMHYFDKVNPILKNKLLEESYYKNKISNSLFYGLQKEFFIYMYSYPKRFFSIRQYFFFSYPMRVLHYSMGLYLLKLSQEFIVDNIKSNKNISSYYGADISYSEDKLSYNKKNTYYLPYYKAFKKDINKELKQKENKIVIKIDMESYFDNVSIKILLNLLKQCVKPSIRKKLSFDEITINQINCFYEYISSGRGGIPQGDNDIISAFIGHLYLVFGDLLIDDELKNLTNLIDYYKIIRYVDDIHIIIKFKNAMSEVEKRSIAINLVSRITDAFYYKLNLRLNQKTKIYDLENTCDVETLKKDLKKVSTGYFPPPNNEDTENELQPQEVLDKVFLEVEKLKISDVYTDNPNIDEEIFKELFNENIKTLLQKRENKDTIKNIFTNFNLELVKYKPKEIILLIIQDTDSKEAFANYILSKAKLSTFDRNVIIEYLCQEGFTDLRMLEKLNEDEYFRNIIESLKGNIGETGYYNLPFDRLSLIVENRSILSQIKLRIINESRDNISVALNHLVNELHVICYYSDTPLKNMKNYKVNRVIEFLRIIAVPNDIIIGVQNLFDRRNNNSVSHAGTEDNISWSVTKEEYIEFKKIVQDCLKYILNKSTP
jgi:AbiA family abortive infection protein